MKLNDILQNIEILHIIGDTNINITNISQDTREDIGRGTIYVALSGTQIDGHQFIDQAIAKGVNAIVCTRLPETLGADVTYILVEDTRSALGYMSSVFYDHPSQQLTVIGVTGTNGKTSVATLIYQMLLSLEQKPLLLSTAGDYFNGLGININRKAPSSLEVTELHRVMAEYLSQGCTHVCLEVTSHAADQDRIAGITFDAGIFTNLSQDHLDYHGTMEAYARAKKSFFAGLGAGTIVCTNADDGYGMFMTQDTQARVVQYGTDSNYHYHFSSPEMFPDHMEVQFNNQAAYLPYIGNFMIYNALAAYSCLVELGYDSNQLLQVLKETDTAAGRLEHFQQGGVHVIVDYAHTPDALEKVLSTLVKLPYHRIITVVGAGGDRDPLKRPLMGRIAQQMSDHLIITSDNPRTEDPLQIIDDIFGGIEGDGVVPVINRRDAIGQAIQNAKPGDVVLIAGKGHENYQEINGVKYPFSDRVIAKEFLAKRFG